MSHKGPKIIWDDDDYDDWNRFQTTYQSSYIYNVYNYNVYENHKCSENSIRKTTTEYCHYKIIISRQLKNY